MPAGYAIVAGVMTITTALPHGLAVGDFIPPCVMNNMASGSAGGIVETVVSDVVFTMLVGDGNSSDAGGYMLFDKPYHTLTIYGAKPTGAQNAATLLLAPAAWTATNFIPLPPNDPANPYAIADKRPDGKTGLLSDWKVLGNAGGDGLIIIVD